MWLIDQIYTQKIQNFQQKYNIFDMMKKNISDDASVLVSISGWADSVLLSLLTYNFFIKHKIPLTQLHFIHFNHNTREENKDDEIFISKFLSNFQYVVLTRDGWEYTEESLRKRRYKHLQKYSQDNNIDYILLWHNLDDRLESTLLNMMRWCDLNWFISMKMVSQHPLLSKKIYRPLIFISKKEILDFMENNKINYVQDPTNFDSEVSMRNHIRKELIPKLVYDPRFKSNKFYDSLNNIYNSLSFIKQKDIELVSLISHLSRNAEYYYKLNCSKRELNNDFIFKIFKKLNISNNISQQTISEFSNFFIKSNKWYKYINNVYFFISHGFIYIIKAKEDFRKRFLDKKIHINKLGKYMVDNIICEINKEIYLGSEIIYAKPDMKYKNKTWNKYCINKKIPVFWRNYIPVLIKDNKIQKVFIPKNMW